MAVANPQRGLATGLNHNKKGGAKWRQSHRERLHFLANDKTSANQEILSPIGNTGAVEYARYPMKELGEYYMDVKLAGGHWQCDGEDGTCDEMNNEIEWAEKDPGEKSNEFKYVFDVSGFSFGGGGLAGRRCGAGAKGGYEGFQVLLEAWRKADVKRDPSVGIQLKLQTDGNAWSSRFPRLMASNK